MRRVLSYLLDIAFLGAPWPALLGTAGLAALGVTMFTSVSSAMLLIVDAAVFLARGRTLGMAVTGLVAATGRRWLALVVHALLLLLASLVAFWAGVVLPQADVLTRAAGDVLVWLVPFAALFFNFVFLVGSQRRTLTDVVSGLHVVRDPELPRLQSGGRRGPTIVDGLIAACVGVPILPALGHPPSTGAAIASFTGLFAFGALELILWTRTGATLGARALARSP